MNHKKGKQLGSRILSWVLAAVMMISLVPGSGITVQAAGSEGTSTDTVSLKVDQRQKVEVALAVGSTKQDYANFENDLKAALKERGVENEDVSFVEVDANATSSKDSFEWWTYDHSTSEAINHANHSYITKTNAYTSNEYDSCSRHILSSNGGATMSFYGYGQMGYTDFNYLPNTQATKKTIEFTIQEKEAHDALDGLGFLVNASITGNSYSTQVINGYLIFLQYNGATGTAIKLYQLNNVSAAALHDGSKSVLQDFSGISGITLLKTADTSYSSNHKYRKIKIEIMPTYLKMWYNGSTSDNQSKVLNTSDLVSWGNTTEYPLTPGYDKDGNKEVYRGGYGPVASYGSHGCKKLTLATLSNLKMEAEYVRSLTEVVREPNWSDDKLSFLVNLNEDPIDDFSEDFTTAEIINRLEQDKVTYIGWCGNNNAYASKVFVDGISSGSGLVNMNDNKFIASGENYYSLNSYRKQVDEIARLIVEKISKQTTTGGVYTYLDTDEFHFSSTGATLNDGNWSVGYSTEAFDKAKDSVNNYSDLANASFLLPGYYEVYYGGDTDTPKAKIRIHQAPKALFTATTDENGTLTVSNTSYDPEVCKDGANADGTEDSGIISSQFEYRNVTDQGEWRKEAPTTIDDNKVWMVRLTVTDADGATDMLVQQVTKKSSSGSTEATKPPFNAFTLSKSQYIKNIDKNIEIIDQSYSLDGNTDFTVEYTITGNGKTIPLSDFTPQTTYTYALSNLSTGSYTISMIAKKGSTTSQKVSKTFTVKEGYAVTYNANGDNVTGLPGTQYKIKDTELALSTVAPSRTGYIFAGWATSKNGEIEYQPGSTYSKNDALTLYAVWKKPFTYQAEGYTGVYDGENHNITVTVTQPESADGITISYAIGTGDQEPSEGNYIDKPAWKDAGTYKVYYKIAKDGYLTVSGYRNMQIDKAQPTVALANKVYQTETGSALTIDAPTVTGVKKENITDGTFTYTYYTDKDLKSKTTSLTGALSTGAAPSKKGIYYVVAHFNGNNNYKAVDSNIATMYIAPDVYYIDAKGEKVYGSLDSILEEVHNADGDIDKTVYVAGDMMLDSDVTIPDDVELDIKAGVTLTVNNGYTLKNQGVIYNQGIIDGDGNVENDGSLTYGVVNTAVTNKGEIQRTTLNDKVSNQGTINNATGSQITNESEDAEVTKKGNPVYYKVTYDAVNGLSQDNAAKVTTPAEDKIPWGNKLSTLDLPKVESIANVAAFEGWYTDSECTKLAEQEEMGVNGNITLYAKWKEYDSYEAYWTDKSGEKHYGSWKDVLKDMEQYPEDVKDVHIQNPIEVKAPGVTLPNNIPLIIDKSGKITLDNDASLTVPGGIENNGTIGAKDSGAESQPKIEAPIINQAPGTISDVQITGNVENGKDASMSNTNITGDLTNDGNVKGGKVDGNVKNNEDGKIENTDIPDEKFDNSGEYKENDGTVKKHKVSFTIKGMDTVIDPATVNHAAKVKEPARPEVEEGKVFSGWYADEACTTLWKFDKNKATQDITLYAKVDSADHFESYWQDENGEKTYGSLQDAFASESKDIHIINSCKVSEDTTTVDGVTINVEGDAALTVSAGKKFTVNGTLQNDGTIRNNGTVTGQITNNGMIQQKDDATITGTSLNNQGSISGGELTFKDVQNGQDATISNATINGSVTNDGEIKGSTLNGTTVNNGEIKNSTLNADVTNDGTISGGVIGKDSTVQNNKKINNTDIQGEVINGENGKVNGENDETKTFTVTYNSNGHDQTIEAVQVAAGAKIAEQPVLDNDKDDVFIGWFTAADGTTEWNFAKNTVSKDITLYAHWTPKADYEARWTDANGKEVFGTLKEALENPKNKDLHIQKDMKIEDTTTIPEGTSLTVDAGVNLTVTAPNGKLDVKGNLQNEGTIKGDPTSDAAQIVVTTPGTFTNGTQGEDDKAKVSNIKVDGDITNNGDISVAEIKGDVTNAAGASITDSKVDGTLTNDGNVAGSEVTGNVDNKKDGTVQNTKITGDVNNDGKIADNSTIIGGQVTNGKNGQIQQSEVSGEVTNNGKVEDSKVSGTITNDTEGKITDSDLTGDITNSGDVTGGTVTSTDSKPIKNEPGANISNATLTGPVDNQGDLTDNNVDAADVDNKGDGKITDTKAEDAKLRKTVTFDVQDKGVAPEAQKVEYGALAKGVQVEGVDGEVVAGWYTNADCANASRWSFLKNVVKKDITLYAKWADPSDFEAMWIEDGTPNYGTLDEALDAMQSGSKEITIQKKVDLPKDLVIPEDVTITIPKGTTVTVPENANITINGTLENNGTLSNNGTIQDNGKITNNGTWNNNENGKVTGDGVLTNNKTIYGGTIDAEVENKGKIDGATLNGKVTNEKGGNITDSTMSSEVTNKAGATIAGGTLEESSHVENEGTISNAGVKGSVENKDNGKIVGSDLQDVTYKVTFDTQGHGTKAPEVQKIVCGRKVTEPARVRDEKFVFFAWYHDKACTKVWDFTKDTVSKDTVLYAKWNPTSAYDVYWTNADGEKDYGTLEDAVKAGGKDIHIQKSIEVSDKVKAPEGATVTIDKDAALTIKGNGQLEVPGGLVNEGTIQNADSTVTPQIIGKVENAGGATIKDATIAGDVHNEKDGQITAGQITGKVDNNGNIEKTDINGDVNNAGDLKGSTVNGNVTNEGTIENSDIKADNVTNKQNGVITGGTIAGNTPEKQPEVTNASGATISGTDITGKVDNAGTLGGEDKATKVNGALTNTGDVQNTEVSGTTTNNGTISDSKLDGETTNNGTISDSTVDGKTTNSGSISGSTVAGKVTNEKDGTITAGTVKGETTNNGTISGSTVDGNVTNNGNLEGVTTAPDAKVDNSNPDATMKDAEGQEITCKVTFDANGHGTAPEAQTVAYGKTATKPADPQDDAYTMRGWYKDADCKTAWDFEKDVVTGDVTIYAKWSLKTEFEAAWKTEDGKDAFGSLEEAVAAGGKDIHIRKDMTIEKDMTIPEGTTVTVEENTTVTIPEGVTVSVPENTELINNGTVKNQSKIDGAGTITNNNILQGSEDSKVNASVVNNGRLNGSEVNGSIENNGIVKDAILNGNVTNNSKINDCEINAGLKNNGKVTADGDEVIYKDKIVKGIVTKGDSQENVDNTTITFQQGNDKKVGSGDVKDGFYQVDKLPNGYYNVVIPSEDGKVNTFFVTVTDDEIQMKEFNLPDGNLSDQVVVKEGTPKIVVDGLAQMLTESVDRNTAGVTSEDQNIAKTGGDVDVTFTATQIETIPDTDVDLEKVIKEDNKSVGMNLDLSVLKTVTTTKGDDTSKTETYLTELNKPIMVYIPIPAEKQGKTGYAIYRSHTDQDGKVSVDKITDEKNADGEYIEVAKDGSAITLHTKKFSTYVLAFDPDKTEEPDTPSKPDVPGQGNKNDTQQTTQAATEAPKTSEGLESLSKQQQKDAKKVMQTLGLTETEAVEIMKFASANNIPVETLLINDATITSQKDDTDIKGSSFARIQAATSKLDKTSVKLKWNKVNGADGYLVFGNKCGKSNKYQFIKEVKGVKTSLALKKLKKGTYYKYVVRAYKLVGDKKVTIALSKTVHATTKGGKFGVAKAVKVNKSKVNLKQDKTFKIKASEIKENKTIKHHRDIVYESSNTAVATVDKNGVVKGIKKESCYVYAYAQNGVYKKIKVTVK